MASQKHNSKNVNERKDGKAERRSTISGDDVGVTHSNQHHQLRARSASFDAGPKCSEWRSKEMESLLQVIRCPNAYPSRLLSTMLRASRTPAVAVDEGGNSLLLHAIKFKNLDAVRELLDLGADPNFINKLKYDSGSIPEWPECTRSTLHDAVQAADIDILKLLLERGADPNQTNQFGMSVLYHATKVTENRLPILKLLLSHGADMNIGGYIKPVLTSTNVVLLRMSRGKISPFSALIRDNKVTEARLFLEHGFKINSCGPQDPENSSLLHIAVRHENEDMLSLLLDYCTKESRSLLEVTDSNKNTPLRLAVMMGRVEHLTLLLEAGANVDFRNDDEGITALEFAVLESEQFYPECIRLLINAGANVRMIFKHLKALRLVNKVANWEELRDSDFDESDSDDYTDDELDSDESDSSDDEEDDRWRNFERMIEKMFIDLQRAKCVIRYRLLYESRITVEEPLKSDMIGSDKLRDYYSLCSNEIAQLQNTSLYFSVTYCNLLTDENFHKHVRDEFAYENFDEEMIRKRFPVYAEDLCSCFSRMKERHKGWELAMKSLSRLLKLDGDAYHLIFCTVLSHLRKKDLYNLKKKKTASMSHFSTATKMSPTSACKNQQTASSPTKSGRVYASVAEMKRKGKLSLSKSNSIQGTFSRLSSEEDHLYY